ncbi:intraflagellar transport protein 122 homolog [Plasmopara halstedii]|uniref:Intraflagellar transport protein 122 homolog n=1 Tax=Plasmopara halstedii TaxID=4781 RepID=A0A0P1AJY1_PLAHL|nr:intraflagellar transport protein 122 homolog [Plasmopara halstedii]CEG41209.1 intraflagellar transport protein 122 homolog [Plasmopara halstedii]|eukprot:XP_024577578.1 intraflagellar transport protein 122 homolog [Plasmopara halstedii]
MRSVLAWSDKVPERNGEKFVVQDLAFKPDGSQVVAAVGTRVLVYDAADGTLLHSLKGHKKTVYAVDYSYDGKRFASGGADNIVIIWTDTAEGILKYTHNDSIQKLVYNPQSQCLASCTASDFGLWAPEQKSVAKHKVGAKILSACWSNDGQILALGLFNGNVTLRDKLGAEKRLIERSNAPVWALAWSPTPDDSLDVLAVGCWDRTLVFYSPSGVMQGKVRKLDYNPTTITYFSKGKYLLVGGSNCKAGLYTKDGIFLVDICEHESWIWAIKARPKTNFVGVGSEDGTLSIYCLVFGTVHGIYQERYAYRENLTDVIVQHLMTEQKVRIKTRDCVRKLSVYRDRLAVQLSDRIIIYELAGSLNAPAASYDMHYRVKERILQDLPCSLLVVTSLHFILCQKQKLQQYDFTGRLEREWILESLIRYIKVMGGAYGREGLLVGLKDGSVWQIFLNNPFPINLIQQNSPISCLDISANREKLAVVDDTQKCYVYDLTTKELLFEESAVNSVAWNTECEDMLCFGGNGQLKIRAGEFLGHTQRMQGFVVGFTRSKVFSLGALSVQTIDVPHSAPLYRYSEHHNFSHAYAVSCLGVTASDWRFLAWEALKNMQFEVARKAFLRVQDVRLIELVNTLEQKYRDQMSQVNRPNQEKDVDIKKVKMLLQGEIMAHQSKFSLAAKLFTDCGEPGRAIQMFTDLRMWDEAKRFATAQQAGDVQQLVLAQARWAEDVKDWRAAAEMYAASGNYLRAIELMGENGYLDELLEITFKPEIANNAQLLTLAANYFLKRGRVANARDMYLKIGDVDALLQMHIRLEEWDEAVALANRHRDTLRRPEQVFLPYGQWLITQDRFDEALEAYTRAQQPDKSCILLNQLIENAITECRFKNVAYYYWRLCEEQLKMIQITQDDDKLTNEQSQQLAHAMENEVFSELYYAYAMIFAFTDEPFTTLVPESLFHAARFLLNKLTGRDYGTTRNLPRGMSLSNIYFTLGHHALQLESYKVARQAYEKLLQMKLRNEWQIIVESTAMTLQAQPYADREELLPVDYRSSSVNPFLNPNNTGDVCINSGHPFIRSYVSFENLPLVEFQPVAGISKEKAEELIQMYPSSKDENEKRTSDGWRETDDGTSQSLKLDDEELQNTMKYGIDLFEQALNRQATYGASVGHRSGAPQYRVLELDAQTLQSLRPNEVFIVKYPTQAIRPKYYKNMIPEIKIHLSPHCRRFFHEEDFEFEYLKAGFCPCCQVSELETLNQTNK